MKKPLLIIIAVICVIVGCKVDEAGFPNATNSLLLGTWYVKATVSIDPILGSDTTTSYTSKDYYIFNSNNTVKASTSQPDTVVTTRYSYLNTGSSSQIIFADVYDSGTSTFTISKLTADSLIMSTIITATAGANTSTIPVIYKLARK
jgi:hypothetical protein